MVQHLPPSPTFQNWRFITWPGPLAYAFPNCWKDLEGTHTETPEEFGEPGIFSGFPPEFNPDI